MFFIYNIILILLALLYLPYAIYKGKMHKGMLCRFGFGDIDVDFKTDSKVVWIHAVSVGEVLAILSLVNKMTETFPAFEIVCSTVTKTGYKLAKEKMPRSVRTIYAPLDFPWAVKKFVKVVNPTLYIAAETEIWANLYRTLNKNNIPIIQVNGRISDSSFKGYSCFKPFVKSVLNLVSVFSMQSELDSQRIIDLGAAADKVCNTGNLKFDSLTYHSDMHKFDLGFKGDDPILIAGSTHRGEEDIIADIFLKLKSEFKSLQLVIVPRHIHRIEEVCAILNSRGLTTVRFSEVAKGMDNDNITIVVDTIGHLKPLYSLASIVFVGKSITSKGGQNVLEPIGFGKPTFVGPNMQNFKSIVQILKKEDLLFQVRNKDELLEKMRNVLSDDTLIKNYARKSKIVIDQLKGATDRNMEIIKKVIND